MTSQGIFDQGKAFGTTFSVIGRNIGLWLGLTIIFSVVPSLLFQALVMVPYEPSVAPPLLEGAWIEPELWFRLQFYALFLAAMLVAQVLSSLLAASIARATIDNVSGRRPSMRDSIRTALVMLLPAIAVGLLIGIGVVIGLFVLIVPGIILWLRWAVAIPVLVQERLGVRASMARSAALTSGFRWPLFGFFLILILASALIQWVFAMTEPLALRAGYWGWWLSLFMSALIDSVLSMVISTASAVSYVELRRLKEGTGDLAEIFS